MSRRGVKAVLWRRVLKATIDTLIGEAKTQYDIRLTADAQIAPFFDGVAQVAGGNGGYTIHAPIAAFDGPNPVPPTTLEVHYMGSQSARKDWNLPSQRPTTAYPLWRPGRAFPKGSPPSDGTDTIILIRDDQNQFHARWLAPAGIAALPDPIRTLVNKDQAGVWWNTGSNMPPNARALSVIQALKAHRSVLLYGPPGTGKTHLLREVQTLFEQGAVWVDTAEEAKPVQATPAAGARVEFVTFHQSFGYEDFVVGLRPDPDVKDKLLALEPTPGILLELTEHARKDGRRSLLLIDEINRGNASRIFGELITLLDSDKRLGDDGTPGPQTASIRLPYQRAGKPVRVPLDGGLVDLPMPFTMPQRVYILATMNSVDKSIAPLDAALRRRFHIERLGPEMGAICAELGIPLPVVPLTLPNPMTSAADVAALAVALLGTLNDGIAAFFGHEFQLGHWFLAPLIGKTDQAGAEAALVEVWQNRLLPQLEEYFQGRGEQLRAILRKPGTDAPVSWREPRAELEEAGGTPVLERRTVSHAAVVTFLRRVADVRAP